MAKLKCNFSWQAVLAENQASLSWQVQNLVNFNCHLCVVPPAVLGTIQVSLFPGNSSVSFRGRWNTSARVALALHLPNQLTTIEVGPGLELFLFLFLSPLLFFLPSCSLGPPKIFCQFDGSAHRAKREGGAGAAMYVLSEQGLQLLDWSCLSIPRCPGNIVAEVLGADLSLRLYERYVHWCLSHNMVPLPLDCIQGDVHSTPAQSPTLPNSVPST